ncbi:MAG: 1-acyl-sn-glycerol-3-phosphate acyltransferase [Clostridia bacterium]|nr:1-acyl-sn-glycerol-3-phosphate acyltransferase [Clostridia bacterium]
MKIKTRSKTFEQVMALPRPEHKKPMRPWRILQTLIRVLSIPDMIATRFTFNKAIKKELPKEPCLILMNHSSFIDLKIAFRIFYPRRFSVVCTADTLVGKEWLMRRVGCIPTQKYVTDLTLIRDLKHALHEKKVSVLMYPEAGYTFDGCATALPEKLGGLLKMLKVPVVTVITHGAFARDPLYNGLRLRRVKVSAEVKLLLTPDEIEQKSVPELDKMLKNEFTFDNFAWQYENKVEIDEPFRATGLERILYKCADCGTEGKMEGKGTELVCHACGKRHTLSVFGRLEADDGETRFPHIPDWYAWERACVREELESGTYRLDTPVDIGMIIDYKALYTVGEGQLTHDENGFVLTGCNGALRYEQKPLASYGLNSDYFWYEIGDVIGIGNREALYYCFPKTDVSVTKARLAAEELYKIHTARKRKE